MGTFQNLSKSIPDTIAKTKTILHKQNNLKILASYINDVWKVLSGELLFHDAVALIGPPLLWVSGVYRGTSLTRNTNPPGITTGP